MTPATVHASAVLVGARAVLIRGPSGAGKSRLALELIEARRAVILTCGGFVIPAAQALFVNRAEAALPPTLSETVATTWPLAATGSLPCTLLEPAGLRSTL